MTITPDIAGFADAQRRHRENFGLTVTFWVAVDPQYDPGVPAEAFDPETGRPYDPTIKPTGGGSASAAVNANVVERPLTGGEQGTPLGPMTKDDKYLIIDESDHATVEDAIEFELWGERWTVTDIRPSGVGGLQRYVVTGESKR